jgi:cardiolipin synthase (CMP-forming)
MNTLLSFPNMLTMLRIAIIPVVVVTFYFENGILARRIGASLFLIASITDFLDGFVARRLGLQSSIGKMLDPIADKLMVGSVLLMLVRFRRVNELPCLLILAREFIVAGLREFLGGLRIGLPVSGIAKFKTFIQMMSLSLILLGSRGSGIEYVDFLGSILLWVTAIFTLITGYSYLIAAIESAKPKQTIKEL